ncbi:MAG: 4-hydroxy-tetrahydrodipicolinate reductase [Clostridia bacterium]|nr:4-hydroxy-tetrahydrodipicolinate reductase [Clostridia bacterium]
MTKILLSGCSGKMGRVIASIVANDPDCEIAGGIDLVNDGTLSFPVFSSPDEVNVEADVIIDFSHPSCLVPIVTYASINHIPVVVCTTGLTPEQKAFMASKGSETAVFFSANMSLGVNVIIDLAKRATNVLEDNFDIEIVEAHHNRKLDAPSGTALYIADAINDAAKEKKEYVYDRHSVRKKREKKEIGIHAIRGGTIVGEHTVIFAGNDEIIELKHTALSRDVFAEGAIAAAKFMVGKNPGMYDMNDLIQSK